MIRVCLADEEGNRFFGDGPLLLLKGIEKTGSLRASAMEMNMAYSKAQAILKRAEAVLGFPLTEKKIGGKGGGGSRLTPRAKEFLTNYEAYKSACCEANRRIYQQIFSPQ